MVVHRGLQALCVALVIAVAGCGGDVSDEAAEGASPSGTPSSGSVSPSPSTAAAELPEGDYRTDPLTAQDLVAAATRAGFPAAKAQKFAAHYTGTVVFELLITADTFVQNEIVDGGPPQLGARADYVVTDADTFVATDECTQTTFDFVVAADRLTLDLVDSVVTGCDIPDDDIILGTMVTESGSFTRQDAGGQSTGSSDQTVDSFVLPFEIQLAEWLDPASLDAATHFATWQSADEQRALRVLSPVSVYLPGDSAESSPPKDFPAYVLSLADAGASLTDRVDTRVDGHPAVAMTVGLQPGSDSLDGTLGCPEAGTAAEDCFGPQDDLVLRLVAVEVDGTPLLIWERDYADQAGAVDYASFDAMVASIHFA